MSILEASFLVDFRKPIRHQTLRHLWSIHLNQVFLMNWSGAYFMYYVNNLQGGSDWHLLILPRELLLDNLDQYGITVLDYTQQNNQHKTWLPAL